MSRALVTGATGFLGTNLVHELVGRGWSVRAFGLPGSETRYLEGLDVEQRLGDITERDQVSAAIEGCEVVFHVAGDTSFWRRNYERQRRVNVDGAVNVAECCAAQGVRRLVHTSTIDALGHNPEGLADETWSTYSYDGWGYNYADTKREGEARVRAIGEREGLEVVVLYPGSMLGPFDFTLQFGRLFAELRDGKVPACPSGGIGFGHVVEVARAHIAAASRGRPGEGYICAGTNATYRDLFELIAARVGAKAPRFDLPRAAFVAYGVAAEFVSRFSGRPPEMNPGMARFMSTRAYYDSRKAVEELGYRIVELSTAVADAHDWYLAEGLLDPPANEATSRIRT
ncbi:MAG: NAD-dependent epimerase/dehydratase family protein [Myxococcota bacterium]